MEIIYHCSLLNKWYSAWLLHQNKVSRTHIDQIKKKNYIIILLMDFIAPVDPPALVTRWDPQLRTAGVSHRGTT